MTQEQELVDFKMRLNKMQHLQSILRVAHTYSVMEIPPHMLAGGDASIFGVEDRMVSAMSQLERMIKDLKLRIKDAKQSTKRNKTKDTTTNA